MLLRRRGSACALSQHARHRAWLGPGWCLRVVFVLGLLAPLPRALAARARGDDAAEARRHAQRASNLAASGKCRQAVVEFDKAMAILRDPALLFNRAECHRKLGDTDAALEDYRQFLSDLPKAPNRDEVENRIAELTQQEKDSAALVPPVAPLPVPATGERAARAPVQPPVVPRTVAPSAVAAGPPAETTRSAVSSGEGGLPALPGSDAPTNPALALGTPAEPSSSSDEGIATRPWFWITIAAVAVAAGVGTFVLLSRDSTSIPSSALGNYKF